VNRDSSQDWDILPLIPTLGLNKSEKKIRVVIRLGEISRHLFRYYTF